MNKKVASLWISAALVLGVTAVAGGVHGILSNRWGPRPSMVAAAAKLERKLPQRIGNWVLRSEDEIPQVQQDTLQCEGYLYNHYEHVENGARISVFVIVGPHGPTAVHTPEICYSSRNHTAQGARQVTKIEDAKGGQHALWDLSFKANNLNANDLRVVYAWSQGGAWQASSRPRYEFAGAPYLYKLQLSGPSKTEDSDFDACTDFLKDFLAEMAQRLAEPAATLSQRS